MRRSKVPGVLVGVGLAIAFPVLAGVGEDDHDHAPKRDAHKAGSDGHAGQASHGKAGDADPHASKPGTVSMTGHGSGRTAEKHARSASAEKHASGKHDTTEASEAPDAETALKWLEEGNARWVADQEKNPNTDAARRTRLADEGQKPFVTVLTCADSRVPVERVFDRGVGDVFTIRVAGNVAGGSETGTIEYGVGHLHTPLLVVMGHTNCGAVAAAATNAEVHGKVADLVEAIMPAVDRAKRSNPEMSGAALVPAAIRENVWQSIFDLYRHSSEVRSLVSASKLRVVGAVYDIGTGKVEFLGEHPWQGELIEAMNARAAARQSASGQPKHDADH